jgi:hypothetical protein
MHGEPVQGVRLSLWRAVTLFRVVILIAGLAQIAHDRHTYAHPGLAYAVGAAMVAVTAAMGWLAVTGRAHRVDVVLADVVVTVLLTLATALVQTPRPGTRARPP